ncbi:hypothetical protein BRE01_48860 [Brevibacillus reuszeri]|uniref:Uncharacterized protein n=1 Tax=Brevibacillus reuszeri TaxID=54915 RepID=A0A0K9YMV1_9BACL|nr:hypothetical protein [Brevibacillus reuszeri]KNB69495.1 hypothetical protein ADS79_26865 [Brevibacillus reuszeri]MED1861620.1 hypothetical protein [Brevibacillus reuszeri]GED71184.1 hypothetical protein BRE01_48860 [Brevibacillus reuszeri]
MKYSPGDEVVIVDDPLNFGLPLDHHAIVMRVDLNTLELRRYLIRVPLERKEYWVSEGCIGLASEVNAKCAEDALRNHMVNISLDKRDKSLFEHAINLDRK